MYAIWVDGQCWVRGCGPWANTNNEAEYEALKAALEYVAGETKNGLDPRTVTIYTDSKLMHGHLMKGWKCQEKFKKWIIPIQVLLGMGVKLEWVPREQNEAGKWFD